MGPGGMRSFGHAAYFGLGAYGAALLLKRAGLPMELALLFAPLVAGARRAGVRLVLRAAVRRLPRDADAGVRADRLVGRLPVGRADRRQQRHGRRVAVGLAGAARPPTTTSTLGCAARACCCCGACCSRPSATRCAPAAIRRCAPRPSASTCAHAMGGLRDRRRAAGLAGALYAYSKGSVSPDPSRSANRSTPW